MHINLKCDIPKELNDMSKGELAKLSMELKKLVDKLNFYLNRLDGENFSDEFNNGISEKLSYYDKTFTEITERLDSIENRISTLGSA